MDVTVSVLQIGDDETVEEIDAFLAGRVEVFGILDDEVTTLRVGEYRIESRKPLVREHNPDIPGDYFERTHYNSKTFAFDREDEARQFHDRFG